MERSVLFAGPQVHAEAETTAQKGYGLAGVEKQDWNFCHGRDADASEQAFRLTRRNLRIYRAGWAYLHRDTLNRIVAFCRDVFSGRD